MKMTHVILKTDKIEDTKNFYETHLNLKNRGQSPSFLSFKFGEFILGFNEDPTFKEGHSQSIGHLGLEFSTKEEVDELFQYFKDIFPNTEKPIGGMGKGPYRFYVKDPHG